MPASVNYKSGFISLVGKPNVGKSTLLNQLLGQKLSIVSPKPQTTRNKVLGIKTLPQAQLIFLDTPGIYRKFHSKLDKRMQRTTYNCLQEVDLVLWLVEATQSPVIDKDQQHIAGVLKRLKVPIFLLVNKIDLVRDKRQMLPLMETLSQLLDFAQVIPLSALKATNLELLLSKIPAYLPAGPRYFPEDMATDQPERFFLAEIIREKVYRLTHQEIPYSCAIIIEKIQEEPNLLLLEAVIFIEHASQKKIIIGKSGNLIKQIGTQARREMEQILGVKVYLNLWVKVSKDWRQQDKSLHALGY